MTPMLSAYFWQVGRCRGPGEIAARGSGWQAQIFPALSVALRHPTHGWILYDTGYDPRYFEALRDRAHRPIRWLLPVELPGEERLEAQMASVGLCPGDFRRVIISHFHLDHVAGLHRLPHAELIYTADAWRAMRLLKGWRAARAVYHPLTVDRTQLETRERALRNEDAEDWEVFYPHLGSLRRRQPAAGRAAGARARPTRSGVPAGTRRRTNFPRVGRGLGRRKPRRAAAGYVGAFPDGRSRNVFPTRWKSCVRSRGPIPPHGSCRRIARKPWPRSVQTLPDDERAKLANCFGSLRRGTTAVHRVCQPAQPGSLASGQAPAAPALGGTAVAVLPGLVRRRSARPRG